LINFIYKNGLRKTDLHVDRLYRGYSKTYSVRPEILEKGFISTTWDKVVAETFASGNPEGDIIYFVVNKLPVDVPLLIIDERYNPMFHENEVLMMPGKINVDLTTKESSYTMDQPFVQLVRSKPEVQLTDSDLESDGGGRRRRKKEAIAKLMKCFPLDGAAGKRLVFYRAIEKRHVEVLSYMDCPLEFEEYRKVIRIKLPGMMNYYNGLMDYIPEVQDMEAYFKKPKKNEGKLKRLHKRWNTFFVHFAIYDMQSNQVLTIHGFEPACLFTEVFNMTREAEVVNAIKMYHSAL
jgi:hypothetical protein